MHDPGQDAGILSIFYSGVTNSTAPTELPGDTTEQGQEEIYPCIFVVNIGLSVGTGDLFEGACMD